MEKSPNDRVVPTVKQTLPSGEKVEIKSTYNEINRLSQQFEENKVIASTHRACYTITTKLKIERHR